MRCPLQPPGRTGLRCQGTEGHDGPCWAEVGLPNGLLRWNERARIGCNDLDCYRDPGHELPHRDGTGRSWWPVAEEEA